MSDNHKYSREHKNDQHIGKEIWNMIYSGRLKLRYEDNVLEVWPREDALDQDSLHQCLVKEDVSWNVV